ncbi:MAG: hypothetical protein DI603_14395 [Roseateles depolymerans]|uniref:Uncharacterized protein n=1 Tax=Roseateles depolymerans TaxID=76731 RepID=A0A2W5DQF3_9BURK|nr:MAG: hypothetical protein DI603_14395 [Roseateles depolymerans]
MPGPAGEFTLQELRRWLALEITRADASLGHSQRAARIAMASGAGAGRVHELTAPPWLELDSLQLQLALAPVRVAWPLRLWQRFRHWTGAPPPQRPARFRFAARGEAGVQLACRVQRDARGRWRAQLNEGPEGGDAAAPG